MATFTNDSKNPANYANQAFGVGDMTWDEANFSWDDAGDATWNTQRDAYSNQDKNSSSLTNQTKN